MNTLEYPLSGLLDTRVRVVHLPIERKISPAQDLKVLWRLYSFFRTNRFELVHSITPKAGLLAMLAAGLAGVPHCIHTFTGQVWANRRGVGRYLLKCLDKVIVFSADSLVLQMVGQ